MALPINNAFSFDGFSIIYSETPNDDVWSNLLRFADLHILRNKTSLCNEDCIFVSTCIKQAYEYYLAGASMSIQTKPLLIYYCFLNLAKALICIKRGESNNRYHGLYDTKFPTAYTDATSILKYETKVNAGIFQILADIFGNSISKNTVLTFENFTSNALELCYDVYDYFGNEINVTPVFIVNHTYASLTINIPNDTIKWDDKILANSTISDDFENEGNDSKTICFYKRWESVNNDYEQMRTYIYTEAY